MFLIFINMIILVILNLQLMLLYLPRIPNKLQMHFLEYLITKNHLHLANIILKLFILIIFKIF